jgi:chromosome partitioning protein
MPVISIATQKGGTAKTTTAVNLAAALHRKGFSVLLIDSDPQANLTCSLQVSGEASLNLYTEYKKEIMGQTSDLRQAVVTTKTGLAVVPSSMLLGNAEQELVSKLARELTFRKRILPAVIQDYNFIIIDCPPAFGMLTINALVASDFIIVPLQGEFLSQKGVESFLDQLYKLKEMFGLQIEVAGFLLTKYSPRKKMNEEIKNWIENQFPGKLFRTFIHTDIRLAAAQQKGLDIFSYAPRSVAALDYERLADEVLSVITADQKPLDEKLMQQASLKNSSSLT